ncbi:MAG TPA: APC family permease [Pyrinomonadaceae bacterium]|nr:APC family permease [Pyrinomonadaceae bacterium]
MYKSLKRFFVGSPMRTEEAIHERLNKKTALAVFSSDALSSVAYSTEAILLVLLAAGTVAIAYLPFIAIGITALLGILVLSYRQTIHAYPSGGGAYIVAKDNLGTQTGLVAAASLLVDYILTVAVSVSAGVAAITSAAQGTRFAFLHEHRVLLCLFFVAFIAVINLRGVRESGAFFAGPTYLFIISMLALIVVGFIRYWTTHQVMATPTQVYFDASVGTVASHALTGGALLWLLMRAFAAGCTALTGVEAISNGIPAFKQPESRNAATTLTVMALIMAVLILGSGFLAYKLNAHPIGPEETLVSAMARHIFGGGIPYYVLQAATAAILVLAANTSFADFPRLASLLAADRFLPRQLASRGDRLVFSNGVLLLALFASVLIMIFKGNEQAMLPLYALGVFISFTLSQAGMVVHWKRLRQVDEAKRRIKEEEEIHRTETGDADAASHEAERLQAIERDAGGNWLLSMVINSIGAVVSFVVFGVITVTKFTHGAWAVVLLIPLIVWMFRSIREHYLEIARQLSTEGVVPETSITKHQVLVPISGIHRGVIFALEYAKSIAPGHVTAVYVDFNEEATQKLREKWPVWGKGVELVILQSPYRSLTRPLLRHVERLSRQSDKQMITVLLPEFVPAKWWHQLLHNQSSLLLKGSLLFKKGVIVTSVPYHLEK